MTSASDIITNGTAPTERAAQRRERIEAVGRLPGLGWTVPLLKLATGDELGEQLKAIWRSLLVPLLGIVIFVGLWAALAPRVETSLGAIPGPAEVWDQAVVLVEEHQAERDKAAAFYERQEARNAELAAQGHGDRVKWREYTGRPTYLDQIVTSLMTVALGFLIATLIAVPVGIMCGLSPTVNGALNPLIQIFKPVSPLAWLPIVTMIVSALYATTSDALPKSLVISAITVTLCSLWPTLINTSLGVSSIDRDLINVSRVLAAVDDAQDHQAGAALGAAADLHRAPAVAGRGLDGADRGGNAGAESRPRKVRLGRVPERIVQFARPHHGRGADHRHHRLPARPGDVRPAGRLHLLDLALRSGRWHFSKSPT